MTGPFMPYFSEQPREEAREGRNGRSFAKFLNAAMENVEGNGDAELRGSKVLTWIYVELINGGTVRLVILS